MTNTSLKDRFKPLQNLNWGFVLKTSGLLSAVVILIIGFGYFASDRAARLSGISENIILLRSTLSQLASYASDIDKDNVLEPPAATDIEGHFGPKPGYFVPLSLNIKRENIDGKPLLYCAFDYGTVTNPLRYQLYRNANGEVESIQAPSPTTIAMAIIDPGINGKYETGCDNIFGAKRSNGDDILEFMTYADMEKTGAKNVATNRKAIVTCAFGQIYTWDEAKQDWACKMPDGEQTASMPTGCPNGQILVERNKKVHCENIEVVAGKTEDVKMPAADTSSTRPNTAQPSNNATPLPPAAPNNANSPDVNLPQPASSNSTNVNVANNITNPSVNTPNVTANNSNTRAQSQNNNSIASSTTDLNEINAAVSKAKSKNLLTEQPHKIAARNQTNLEPGQSIYQTDFDGTEITEDAQRLGTNNSNGDNSSIEMTIKRKKQTYKLKSCTPWTYLPRSLGVVNQCIHANDFGDAFGNSAKTTSWPAAKVFLQSAFIICPIGQYGEKPNCHAINFDRNLFATNTPPHIFSQNAFICARMNGPLPPPWPQFESFVYSESIANKATCRIDQAPIIDKNSANGQVLCLTLPDIIDAYRNNGYCGCGWSLIWDPTQAKFICT